MSSTSVLAGTATATLDDTHALEGALLALRRPQAVRQRCAAIAAWVASGASPHFTLDRSRLPAVAQRIATLTRARFPDLKIPYHSRWRHFEAGGVDRKALLDERLAGRSHVAVARARIDLTLVSVLLDAGAGPHWRYTEPGTGLVLGRSEGLAVASFHAFLAGRFSSDLGDALRVDAAGLLALTEADLAALFQVGPDNPLVGLAGRTDLLHRLGRALREQPQAFTSIGQPGHVFDVLTHHRHAPALQGHHLRTAGVAHNSHHHHVTAERILGALLTHFSAIWPSGQWLEVHGQRAPLGDAWRHPQAGGTGADAGWVPFHKLSQWLSYSLLEPFEWAGVQVTGLDELTGLPEYRNGGLLLDTGVVVPRDADFAAAPRTPADPWVIEWRALTVALLDELAPLVRAELGVTAAQLPLACMLEGGSWAAGRQIAAERRLGGPPPLAIDSDGTVF